MAPKVHARRRHVQQDLALPKRHGGKRKGAGRPAQGPRSSERHKARRKLSANQPTHVTVRVLPAVGSLRRRNAYRAIRYALYSAAAHDDFRVVHVSLQRTHIHFIVEAANEIRLARGMQGLLISAAKHLNREISKDRDERRRGTVFPDRYHAKPLASPRACRNAISYVLNNWRKHGEYRSDAAARWLLDPFSSAASFGGWKELCDSAVLFQVPASYERLHTCAPQTWLLRIGWTKHGLIGAREVPGHE